MRSQDMHSENMHSQDMHSQDMHSHLATSIGTIFFSELAGLLFTPYRSVAYNHIEHAQQNDYQPLPRPGENGRTVPTHSSLPEFSLEEKAWRVGILESEGILLLGNCPVPLRAKVPYQLWLPGVQAPNLSSSTRYILRSAKPPQKLAYLQLMTLVAFDWWDTLSDWVDRLYRDTGIKIGPNDNVRSVYRVWKRSTMCWVDSIGLSCSRGHENTLRCLLDFFFPLIADNNGIRYHPRILRYGPHKVTLLEAIGRTGFECTFRKGSSNLNFPPRVSKCLQEFFAHSELLEDGLALEQALSRGDATLSELFLSWTKPSSLRKLVLQGSGVSLLQAACKGNLLASAKSLVLAGAEIPPVTQHFRETCIHIACESYNSSHDVVDLVRYLHELGDDLFAQKWDGQTPLHIAARKGALATVQYILAQADSRQRHVRDNSGMTPLMLADKKVEDEFSPWRFEAKIKVARDICRSSKAYVAAWHIEDESSIRSTGYSLSVHQLLYERCGAIIFKSEKGDLSWIHLPANNLEWCDDLLLRWYIEGNGRDKRDLAAAQQALGHQHVSRTRYDRFFRPGVHCDDPQRRIVFIAAPYMDYERSSKLNVMQSILKQPTSSKTAPIGCQTPDEALYAAYKDEPGFHPRRTLDQYVYFNMDTSERDADQVIQRFQTQVDDAERTIDPVTIMVDQLWMWVLGDELLVTCCPQRWNPPEEDQDAIFERFRAISKDPFHFKTASDLAVQFMTECFGDFDRHARGKHELQFMSMFEQSIGKIGVRDSDLLKDFSAAYTALKCAKGASDNQHFVDILNDLTLETELLSELKDIRDELHIMNTILLDQERICRSFLALQIRVLRRCKTSLFSSVKAEVARLEDSEDVFHPIDRILKQGLQDISQLDAQASRLSGSLSELLQLKQAHYNAFELEYSRKQGRAVLVFTIVTIIFSPLSFVAAFFTMPLVNLPKDHLQLSYVSTWVFSLGFAVAVPCILLAFYLSTLQGWWSQVWGYEDGTRNTKTPGASTTRMRFDDVGQGSTATGTTYDPHAKGARGSYIERDTSLTGADGQSPNDYEQLRENAGLRMETKVRKLWRKRRSLKTTENWHEEIKAEGAIHVFCGLTVALVSAARARQALKDREIGPIPCQGRGINYSI